MNLSTLSAPIGVFDSGLGGLSVYQHLQAQLPYERVIYFADTLNVPYGNRSAQDIVRLTELAVSWLVHAGCKLIVIACNSASAYALERVRTLYPAVPIVGLVPALKPAVLASQNKQVAVLATRATLEGELLARVINEYATPHAVKVIKYFDADLVPWVEAGMPTDAPPAKRLREMLNVWTGQGVDFLVLGCTHYPFFRPFLEQEIFHKNYNLRIVDSGKAIADRVVSLLKQHKMMNRNSSDIVARIEAYSIEDVVHRPAKVHTDLQAPALQFYYTDISHEAETLQQKVKQLLTGRTNF